MSSINYTVKQGERWDQLAYRFYGSVNAMNVLTTANPTVPLSDVLEMGTVLIVPILDQSDSSVITQNLPPWKQP